LQVFYFAIIVIVWSLAIFKDEMKQQ